MARHLKQVPGIIIYIIIIIIIIYIYKTWRTMGPGDQKH